MKSIRKKCCLVLTTAVLVLSVFAGFMSLVTAQELSIQFGIDSYCYLEGRNMTVSGQVLNGTVGEGSVNVTLMISNATGVIQTNNTETDADGAFSLSLPVPSPGEYNIKTTSQSGTSSLLNFVVLGHNDVYEIEAEFTSKVLCVSLSSDLGAITSNLDTTGMVGGTASINGTYSFLVDKTGGKYTTVYLDDDSDLNFTSVDTDMSPIANLDAGSRIKLGGASFKLFYIDPLGTELILVSPVEPLFSGETGSVNITALALNASGSPVSNRAIALKVVHDNGTVLQSSGIGNTNSYGLITAPISIPSSSGINHLIFNSIGHISFSVENYELRGYLLSSELEPQHTFAAGDSMFLAAVLSDASTNQPISNASVRAVVSGPGGFYKELSLSYDENLGMWKYDYTLPSATGDYKVVYEATLASGEKQKAFSSFEIRGYDLFLKPVCPERPELEGFSPGDNGFIFVAGVNLSSGDMADIDGLTGNANKTNFMLEIVGENGTEVTGTWDVMNLSTFFGQEPVPPWVQDEIKRHAGAGACIINFTAPSEVGVYKVAVRVNLSGTREDARTSIGVQRIFVHGEPVTSDGKFSPIVSKQENVTLRIMAFNPAQGTELPASNITDAGLLEVFSEGDIVTEYMENPSFVDKGDYKGLKFYVNDTDLGFHHVKFWVEANVDGTSTVAVGEGWFETRQFFIWANPEGEGGVFKAFGSNSPINLTVHVTDSSFNPKEGATASIAEIRYGKNWEKIAFNEAATTSGSTDANGTCSLSATPINPLKSGWYDVRIKVSAQDVQGNYITDYGRGWFEVRNFIFDVYPETWDVKAEEPINFTVRVMKATDLSAQMNATVSLKKIIYMGSWANPQPPKLIAEPSGVSKDITTNITTSATITCPGTYITRSGGYEFVFEATSEAGIEEQRAWIECRPFITWVYPAGDDWAWKFGIGENMSIIVEAMDGWGGEPHNISAAKTNITMIMKEGWRMDKPYRTQEDIANTIWVKQETSNKVNITLNLTDWAQGSYFATIKVVDSNNTEVYTDFWFQVELVSISIPEFYHMGIQEGNVHTRRASFNVTQESNQVFPDDEWWPDYNYSIASNSYVERIEDWNSFLVDWWRLPEDQQPLPFWALVNRTSPQTLYINYENANFSDTTNTTAYQMGDTLTERGRKWNITRIGSDGVIKLEGINTLASGFMVDTSLSLSGEFLIEDWMHDEEWLKVDLNGDGDFWEGDNDRYFVLMADNQTSGIYDTVLVSNTTNFINDSIDAMSGGPVGFGGAPIYLINMRYENGRYELEFTSYRSGWDGMWLGTFQEGTTVKIPFLVTTPGGDPIAGANVEIDALTWYGPASSTPIAGASNTTNVYGLALLDFNTTGIKRGQHLLHYNVTLPAPYNTSIVPEEKWNLPGVEIRNFVVNAELGIPGEIVLDEISEAAGNMHIYYGEELDGRGAVSGWYNGSAGMIQIGWPFDMEDCWYYNETTGTYFNDSFGEIPSDNITLTRGTMIIRHNFTEYYPEGYNMTINESETKSFCNFWNITVDSIGAGNATLIIEYSLDEGSQPQDHTVIVDSYIHWAPGELNIKITEIDNSNKTVSFELSQPKFIANIKALDDLADGDETNDELNSGRVTVAKADENTMLYAYDSITKTSEETAWQWSPTFDRIIAVTEGSRNTYLIGEPISELGDSYVAMAPRWGGRIITINSSIDAPLYPLPDWAPDGDIYYAGTFTEENVSCDINDDLEIDAMTTYYVLLSDKNANGRYWPDEGRYDDDTDFTDVWVFEGPFDMYGVEQGYESPYDPGNFSERWIDVGGVWGWPFAVPSLKINETSDTAALTTLAQKEFFKTEENVTIWIKAKKFDNTPITGNISVDKLIVLWKESMDMEEEGMDMPDIGPQVLTNITATSTITNGEGTLILTNTTIQDAVGDFNFGEFLVMLNVTESSGGSETMERHFMIFSSEGGKPAEGGY